MNKKKFIESLMDVYCRLAPVAHGIGVVAVRRIPKGTDPFKNCDPFGDVIKLPEKELEALPCDEAVKNLVRDFCARQNGVYFVPDYGIDAIDKSFYLNHSDDANMETFDEGETFVAARDILPGEELTADYHAYNETRQFKL